MENQSHIVDKNGHTVAHQESSKSCTGLDRAQHLLAEKLENIAGTIHKKTAGREKQSETASYAQEAADILHQSAEYVRDFDYETAEADVRHYIKEQPGQCLLIAGGVGLLLGILLRRK